MLENLFGSKTRVKLLNLFFENPDNCFYVREIVRKLKENINSVRREIINLEKIGVIAIVPWDMLNSEDEEVQKGKKEKRKYYQINKEFIVFDELRSLISKSKLLLDKTSLEKLKHIKGIKLLVLSGIFVDDRRARTDMLIVGTVKRETIKRIISRMERSFDHPLRYSIMTQREYNYRNGMTDRFLFEVMEGKKIVIVDKINQ